MSSTIEVSNFMSNNYTPSQLAVMEAVIHDLTELGRIEDLNIQLVRAFGEIDEYMVADDIRANLNMVTTEFIIDEVMGPVCGVIIGAYTSVPLVFLAGLLEFYINLDKFNAVVSLEVYDILTDDNMDAVHKLGVVAEIYQPAVHALDAYDIVDTVPEVTMVGYETTLSNTIAAADVDANAIHDLIDTIQSMDAALLATKLFTYVVSNNAHDAADELLLAYITASVHSGTVSPTGLGAELLVYSLITNTTLADMIDITEDLYDDMDTSMIVAYLNKHMERIDEH